MYGNDKTPEIMKPLYINLFLHGIPVDNITNRNSVSQTNCWEQFERFDCVVGNPPYGMSIKSDPQDYVKEINKLKYNYWPKFMCAKKTETVKDSMGQFMVHTINSLKVGGRFGLVIDRGILNNGTENNSWQKKLRQWMLTVCDFQTLILLPKGIFTHTQFDTAIIYGVKKIGYVDSTDSMHKPSTSVVKVYEAKFADDKNKTGIVVDLTKPNLELSIKQIVNKDWSLKYDDYVEKKEESYEGIQYKTLGEVCEYEFGKRVTKSQDEVKGDYNGVKYSVYGGGGATFQVDKFNREKGTLIISRFGVSPNCVRIVSEKFWLHDNGMSLKYKTQNKKYIDYFLLLKQQYIYDNYTTHNAQARMDTDKLFREIKIPILPADHQARIVSFMDTYIGSDYKSLDRLVSEFKDIDLFKFLLYEDYDTFEVMIKLAKDLEDYDTNGKKRFNTRRRWCFSMVPGKLMTLGELVEIVNYKPVKIENACENGKYPFYNCSILGHLWSNEYLYDDDVLLMNKTNGSGKCRIYHNNGKFSISGGVIVFKTSNNKFYNIILNSFSDRISKKFVGGDKKNINLEDFKKVIIPVPSDKDQEKVVKMIEQINKEEGDFSNQIKSIKENIVRLYQCVDQLVGANTSNSNEETNTIDNVQDNSDENQESDQAESEPESESDDEQFKQSLDSKTKVTTFVEPETVEIEIKGKAYIKTGTNVYVKTKKGKAGELYGTWNASTGKVKKVAPPKEIEV